jgi:hypothetical protein
MKARELVELSGIEQIDGTCYKSLTGRELLEINKIITLESLDEFKNKNVKIIEKILISEQEITTSKNGINVKSKSEPELINIMDGEGLTFNENIELYSMFLSTSDEGKSIFVYRVTPESIAR